MDLVEGCLFGMNIGCDGSEGNLGRGLARRFIMVLTQGLLGVVRVKFIKYAQPR